MSPATSRLFIVALVIAEICSSLEVTMVYTALPSLTRVFHDPAGVGWIITACLLVSAAAAALCGRLGDLYGHRRLLLIVLTITIAGSSISALSRNLIGIVVGAALQGASGAILPLCLALIRQNMPADRVPMTVGIVLAAATGSAAIGLAVGGLLVDTAGWNSIFVASGAWAVLSAAVVWAWVPRRASATGQANRVDMVQGVLFVPAITGFLLALTLGKDRGWGDPLVLAMLAGSLLLLGYWARHQLRQAYPLIHLRALADRRIATAYFCMAMVGAGMTQHTLIMAMLLQQKGAAVGFGLAAGVAGSLLMPVRLVGVLSSAWCGRVIARRGGRFGLLSGAVMAATGWTLILFFHDRLPVVMVGMLLEGAGYLVCYVAIPNILLAASPPERAGEITGLSTVFRAAFSAIGAQLVMLLLATANQQAAGMDAPVPSVLSFRLGFLFILLICIVCGLAAWSLPNDDPRRRA